jgi:hypothetical protein
MADGKSCCGWAVLLLVVFSALVLTQGAGTEAENQIQAGQDQRTLDIPLHGRCRPEILYHCAHVLTVGATQSALRFLQIFVRSA